MTTISKAFLEYFQTEFFSKQPEEFAAFEKSLLRPLKKTIRINTNKIDVDTFRLEKEATGWKFGSTPNSHVFHVDRTDTSVPLGSTLEHIRGNMYIQELSASMSVWHLAEGRIHSDALSILEMAASPGGKTTQLTEHFPNATIVANEFSKERMNALIENVERMGSSNIGITNLNGVQFRELPETFDLVLLDAPCSGEGIGYKAEESLRYWNIKNVRTIARLQSKLLESGLIALKEGGTLLYSTCTLNRFENEGVIESVREKFGDAIEVSFLKRFWPHTEIAGGFFVAKILKKKSFETKVVKHLPANTELSELTGRDRVTVEKSLLDLGANIPFEYELYRYRNDILLTSNSASWKALYNQLYFIRFGMRIGRLDGNFVPGHFLGANFLLKNIPQVTLGHNDVELYLKGFSITSGDKYSGLVQLFANNQPLSIATSENGNIKNLFPRTLLRK